ncbi:MAG: hypothetical protein WBD36_07490, partial [Bacteroidota bacterium]
MATVPAHQLFGYSQFLGKLRCRLPQILALVIIPLVGMCTFPGCYTFVSISETELVNGYPRPERAIRVTLRDSSVIHSPEYLHIATNEPTDVIMGIGQYQSTSTTFEGIVEAKDVDSVREVPGVSLLCWMKNKTCLGFREGQYLMLTSEDRPGFWCAGPRTTRAGITPFKGMLTR